MCFGDLVTGGAGNIAVENGDVIGIDARACPEPSTISGDVGGDRFEAQAISDGFRHERLVLDDQHTHIDSMLRAGTYRQHIENP